MFNNFSPYSSYGQGFQYQPVQGNVPNQQLNSYTQAFQQQPQPVQQNTNITFVNGMEGAKAFQMSPNSSLLMMDADNSKFYVKTTDNLGIAKISSYSFTEENLPATPTQQQDVAVNASVVSKDEYDALVTKVSELESFKNDIESKLKDLM